MIHTFCSTCKLRAHEILMADYFVVCNKPNEKNGNKLGKQIHLQVEQKKSSKELQPLQISLISLFSGKRKQNRRISPAPSRVRIAGKHERNSSKPWPPWHFFSSFKINYSLSSLAGSCKRFRLVRGRKGERKSEPFFHPLFRKLDIFRSRHIKE